MDSQHLFGARGDTDSCLLLWAVHVAGVRIWRRRRWSWAGVVGGLDAALKSKTFWESTPCQFLVVLWICDIVACGRGVVLRRISQTDVGPIRAAPGEGFLERVKCLVGGTERQTHTKFYRPADNVLPNGARGRMKSIVSSLRAINTTLRVRLIWSFWLMTCARDFQESRVSCVCVYFSVFRRSRSRGTKRHT